MIRKCKRNIDGKWEKNRACWQHQRFHKRWWSYLNFIERLNIFNALFNFSEEDEDILQMKSKVKDKTSDLVQISDADIDDEEI